ncbi:MAG: MFS transporter, partial [Yaniella sp.]|nr:MFS transporter [Yaniella sp.]
MTTLLKSITEAQRQQLHRRTLTVVLLSQTFGGAGLAAGISVGALIAQDMLGTEALLGLPPALFTLGA